MISHDNCQLCDTHSVKGVPFILLSKQPLIHALGWTLLNFLWQGAIIALVIKARAEAAYSQLITIALHG
jgi:hypothetical protein